MLCHYEFNGINKSTSSHMNILSGLTQTKVIEWQLTVKSVLNENKRK